MPTPREIILRTIAQQQSYANGSNNSTNQKQNKIDLKAREKELKLREFNPEEVIGTADRGDFYDADTLYGVEGGVGRNVEKDGRTIYSEGAVRLGDASTSKNFYPDAAEKRFRVRDANGNKVNRPSTPEEQAAYAASMMAVDNFASGVVPASKEAYDDLRQNPLTPENKDIYDSEMKKAIYDKLAITSKKDKFDDYGRQVAEVYNPNAVDPNESLEERLINTGTGQYLSQGQPIGQSGQVPTQEAGIPDMDVIDRAANVAKAGASMFTNTAVVSGADWIGDATGLWDIGTEEEKRDMVNGWFGYDDRISNAHMDAIKSSVGEMWDKGEMTWEGTANVLKHALANPETTSESLGFLAGMLLGAGKFTKAGKALSSANKITDPARRAAKVAQVKKATSPTQLAGMKLAQNAGLINTSAGMTTDQVDEFTKNNDGVAPTAGQVAIMLGTNIVFNSLDRFIDMGILKSTGLVKNMSDGIKNMSKAELKGMLPYLAKTSAVLVANAPKEFGTEYVQNMSELVNKQLGTTEFGDSLKDIVTSDENIIESATAGVAGVGGAAHFSGAGVAKDAGGKALDWAMDDGKSAFNAKIAEIKAKQDAKKADEEVTEAGTPTYTIDPERAAAIQDLEDNFKPGSPFGEVNNGNLVLSEEDKVDNYPEMVAYNELLVDELGKLPPKGTSKADDLQRERIIANIVNVKEFTNQHFADPAKQRPILNNIPIKQLKQELETATKANAPKEQVELLQAKIEVAELIGQGLDPVHVNSKDKISPQESTALKFYGGTVDGQPRTGLLNWVSTLTDENMPNEVKAELLGKYQNFANQENNKVDAYNTARKEYIEANKNRPKGDEKVIEFQANGRTQRYHGNSGPYHQRLIAEQQLMNDLVNKYAGITNESPANVFNEDMQEEYLNTGNVNDDAVLQAAQQVIQHQQDQSDPSPFLQQLLKDPKVSKRINDKVAELQTTPTDGPLSNPEEVNPYEDKENINPLTPPVVATPEVNNNPIVGNTLDNPNADTLSTEFINEAAQNIIANRDEDKDLHARIEDLFDNDELANSILEEIARLDNIDETNPGDTDDTTTTTTTKEIPTTEEGKGTGPTTTEGPEGPTTGKEELAEDIQEILKAIAVIERRIAHKEQVLRDLSIPIKGRATNDAVVKGAERQERLAKENVGKVEARNTDRFEKLERKLIQIRKETAIKLDPINKLIDKIDKKLAAINEDFVQLNSFLVNKQTVNDKGKIKTNLNKDQKASIDKVSAKLSERKAKLTEAKTKLKVKAKEVNKPVVKQERINKPTDINEEGEVVSTLNDDVIEREVKKQDILVKAKYTAKIAERTTEFVKDTVKEIKSDQELVDAAYAELKEHDQNASLGTKMIKQLGAASLRYKSKTMMKDIQAGNKLSNKAEELYDATLGDHYVGKPSTSQLRNYDDLFQGIEGDLERNKADLLVKHLEKQVQELAKQGKIAGVTAEIDVLDRPVVTDKGVPLAGYQNISRLFMGAVESKKKPGTLTDFYVHPTVRKAIALASLDWLANVADEKRASVRSDLTAKGMLGIDPKSPITIEDRQGIADIDGIVSEEANTLGALIWEHLDIKAKPSDENVNREALTRNMKTELGLLALLSMENANWITMNTAPRSSTKNDDKFISGVKSKYTDIYGVDETKNDNLEVSTYNVTFDPNAKFETEQNNQFTTGNSVINQNLQSVVKTLQDTLEIDRYSTGVSFKPIKLKESDLENEGVSSKVGTTTDAHKAAVKKQTKTWYGMNNIFTGLYDILNKDGFLEGKFGVDDNIQSYHKEQREAVRGKNRGIKDAMKYLEETRVDLKKSGQNKMWVKWYIVTNNRFGIKSNTFNWQDKKLHRHAVERRKKDIRPGTTQENMFKLGLAQAMGISIDKMTMQAAFEKLKDKTEAIDKVWKAEGVKAAYEYVLDNGGKNEPEFALLGLAEYMEYRKHLKNKPDEVFRSGLALETDAITSGYILKLMQQPIFRTEDGDIDMEKVFKELNSGGVFEKTEDKNKTYGEWISEKANLDAYQKPAKILSNKLKDKKAFFKDKGYKAAEKGVDAVLDLLGENVQEGMIELSRQFMKNPFMVFNYGSAINSIVKNLQKQSTENLYALMSKAANGGKVGVTAGNQILAILDAIDYKFPEKSKHKLTKFKNDFKNASKKELLELDVPVEVREAIQKYVRKTIFTPFKETFEESYGEFLDSTRTINETFTLMFKAALPKLDAALDKRMKENNVDSDGFARPLTEKEIDEEIYKLRKVFPIFEVAFADSDENVGLIAKTDKGDYSTETNPNISSKAGVRDAKGKLLYANSKAYKLISSYSSGSVIPIHFEDSAIQAEVLRFFEAIGIHDANLFDVDNALPGTRKYNEITYKIGREYSMMTKILESLHDTLNSMSKEELDTVDRQIIDESIAKALNQFINSKLRDGSISDPKDTRAFFDKYTKEFMKLHKDGDIYTEAYTDFLRRFFEETKKEFNISDNEDPILQLFLDGVEGVDRIYTEMYKLQKTSEEGRYQLYNNRELYVEHAALEGAGIYTEAEAYTKQEPKNPLTGDAKDFIGVPKMPAFNKGNEVIINQLKEEMTTKTGKVKASYAKIAKEAGIDINIEDC